MFRQLTFNVEERQKLQRAVSGSRLETMIYIHKDQTGSLRAYTTDPTDGTSVPQLLIVLDKLSRKSYDKIEKRLRSAATYSPKFYLGKKKLSCFIFQSLLSQWSGSFEYDFLT